MLRRLKTVLLWLLVLALPIQGAAAATLLVCGPIHRHMATAQPPETAGAQHHHHATAGKSHSHDHGTMIASASVDQSSTNAHDLPSDNYSCSACAACCTGAAISGSGYRAPELVPVAATLLPSDASAFSGFIPETPEHPPRHILV